VCIYASDDGGVSFKTLSILNDTSEAALVLLPPGHGTGILGSSTVYYNARHQTGKENGTARVVGWSSNSGATFQIHPDPNSPPDTVSDAVPGPLLAMQGVTILALPLGPERSNIAVHASPDGGKTWTRTKKISSGYGGYSGLSTLPLVRDNGGRAAAAPEFGLVFEGDPLPGQRCSGPCTIRFSSVPLDFEGDSDSTHLSVESNNRLLASTQVVLP
jgi:hypothetical protein